MRVMILALCLVACSPAPSPVDRPQPAPSPPPAEVPGPVDMRGEWRLTAMNGRPAPAPDSAGAHHAITMTVGDFTLRAQSQCVPFWRRYEWEGGRLVVTGANPGAMCARGQTDWETEFSRTLSAITAAQRPGDGLRLTGPDASLTFEPAPPLPNVDINGRWRLRFFHGAAPPAGQPPIEITIADGSIEANECVFSGWRYRQDGPLMEVTPVRAPVCERMTSPFEDRFGDFMDRVTRATLVQDGALILDSAAEQVEFRRVR
jgi:hypothetical protein